MLVSPNKSAWLRIGEDICENCFWWNRSVHAAFCCAIVRYMFGSKHTSSYSDDDDDDDDQDSEADDTNASEFSGSTESDEDQVPMHSKTDPSFEPKV
jgi:hypothetical protein